MENLPKVVKIGLGISILLFLILAGYMIYRQTNLRVTFVKEIDPNLSGEDRKIFEDRLNNTKFEISNNSTIDDNRKYELLIHQGYTELSLGKLEDAKGTFERAIETNPNSEKAYIGYSQVLTAMTDYQEALKQIKLAIQKNQTNVDAWNKYIDLQSNQLEASNETISSLYSEGIVKTSGNLSSQIDLMASYASWLDRVGNLQASKEYWQKLIVLNPESKKIYEAEIKAINARLSN